MNNLDLLPRVFQADIGRLYERVIRPALSELQPDKEGEHGQFVSFDSFLDAAEKMTSNLLAYEVRRCYSLVMAAVLERQLRIAKKYRASEKKSSEMSFDELLQSTAEVYCVKDNICCNVLRELHGVANAIRHGEGRAVSVLREQVPGLWPDAVVERNVEDIQITNDRLISYFSAMIRFWGLADKQPFAVLEYRFSTH
jgi:hypothetical protein